MTTFKPTEARALLQVAIAPELKKNLWEEAERQERSLTWLVQRVLGRYVHSISTETKHVPDAESKSAGV